jgi:hypothetical protein
MATDRTPSKAQVLQDAKARREAKLAEALRANLRRRKAEAAAKAGKTLADAPAATDGDSA